MCVYTSTSQTDGRTDGQMTYCGISAIFVVCRDYQLSPWFCVTAVKISVLSVG